MLTLEQIRSYFSEQVARANPRGVLVEYLQYELLDSLYKLPEAAALSFIGGTAIRMLRQSPRFSEYLDFDNFGLTYGEFEQVLQKACRDMELKGFLVEYRMVEKGAYHCYVRFPKILYETGISPDSNEKVLVRVDTERKERFYEPQRFLLNRFTVYRQVLVAPLSILLSQKMMTVMLRKREKGRDVFDVSLLLGVAEPDYGYMGKYLGMEKEEIVEGFTKRVGELDLGYLARDVEPFLFDAGQKERVLTFREYWGQGR
ncbi:MAG: nucleotidyl transferase AbiEii/AbiGii toxin family protein [Desulfobacterota bacterium]|nr:nucleotidyl transferase AbiEii/AbiGii toxin family protein [Thermodesulfobacteriota bacterium]